MRSGRSFDEQVKPLSFAEAAVSGIGGVGCQLADVMRQLQTEDLAEETSQYTDLALQFMAPVTTVFASWVLGQAREQGIERLYFCSRDCQLTWKAAQVLAPEFGGIDCRYLQVSKSILLPSSSDISERGMPWLFGENKAPVLGGLLARLELGYEEFIPFFLPAKNEGEMYVLRTEEDRSAFWSALRHPVLYEKMTKRVCERKEAARSYFETQGLFDSVRWAVVDVGWSLNIQAALRGLMRSWAWAGEVHGFYLGVLSGRKPLHETGPITSLFYGDLSAENKKQPVVFKNLIVIENLLGTANHPSVHRYEFGEDGTGIPRYHREVPAETLERFNALEKWTQIFAKRFMGVSKEGSDTDTAVAIIDALMRSFFKHAPLKMVKPLMDVQFSFTRDDLHQYALIRPLTWREALVPVFPSWAFLKPFRKSPVLMWHKGAVVVSSRWVRALYFVAYRVRSVRIKFTWFR